MTSLQRGGLGVVLAAALAFALMASSTPANAQQQATTSYIAPTANTSIPVYDTAWQMFARATPEQADEYFAELKSRGFSGAWAAVISHAPSTYDHTYPGGGTIGSYTNGEIVLSPGYIAHVNDILDKADAHGMRVGLVVAWQNLYLPGGQSDSNLPASDLVRETLTTANADAYGRQMVAAFGSHPAVNAWIFGGDGGTNNTVANIAVWDVMADAIRDEGSTLDIGIHLPPYEFNSLLYADVDFLDFAAPEIGHNKTPAAAQWEMEQAVAAYDIPVWMGEARYFNNDFKWLPVEWRNPGAIEMAEDAQASENAGVSGYLYGDSGRWNWCAGYGDSTPCDPANIADSFGPGEDAVLAVFAGPPTPPTTTTTTSTTTTTQPVQLEGPEPILCDGLLATIAGTSGDDELTGTDGPDVIAGLQGNDIIRGLGGDDVICGGAGHDEIHGNRGADTVFGGKGNDRLAGGKGNDRLRGGRGSDVLVGNNGADDLHGGNGKDRIDGDIRDTRVRGGKGFDICAMTTSSDQWSGCEQFEDFVVATP